MNKRMLILLCLFVLLGAAVLIHEQSLEKKSEDVPSELDYLFPSFDSEKVSSIVLGSFGGSITLIKKSGSWFVEDGDQSFPADKEAIDKMFETTGKLKGMQIVSRNPAKHITFQVNAPQETTITDEAGEAKPLSMGTMGTEVTLIYEDGTSAAHFFVGKNGSMDFMTTYIRKADSEAVLLTEGYLKMVFGKGNAAAWKDLLLCKIEPEKIQKITIGTGDNAIELMQLQEETNQPEQPKTQWKMVKPDRGVIEDSIVQKITGLFRNLRASDFAEQKENATEYGFDNPQVVLALTMMDSQEIITFTFGKETDDKSNQCYLKKDGNDSVFVIPKYRLDSIPKTPDEFFIAP